MQPLTETCPKPALTFAGGYRIVDFVLSNLYNSQIRSVFVLLQHRPEVLLDHLRENWQRVPLGLGEFVEPALAAQLGYGRRFAGTADAVGQALDLLDGYRPELVAVFAADHVYRMDVRQMAAFHVSREADATVAALPVPLEQAREFGVIDAVSDGRVRGFEEKPREPRAMPGEPARAFASMGNYLFRPQVLRTALREAAARGETDFGRHVLPRLARTHRVYAYNFGQNYVPGLRYGEQTAYWRDIGNPAAYAAAHWDLLGPRPRLRLDNSLWPIYSGNAPRSVGPLAGGGIWNTILGPDARAQGARVRNSVLQRGARVAPGATLEHCIVMDGVAVASGARFRGTILGRGGRTAPAAL